MGPPHPRPQMSHPSSMGHPGLVPRQPPPHGYAPQGPPHMSHGGYQYGGYPPQNAYHQQPMIKSPHSSSPGYTSSPGYPGAPPPQMPPQQGMHHPGMEYYATPSMEHYPPPGMERYPPPGMEQHPPLGMEQHPPSGMEQRPPLGIEQHPPPGMDALAQPPAEPQTPAADVLSQQ